MSVNDSQPQESRVTQLTAERESLLSEFKAVAAPPLPGGLQVLVFGRQQGACVVERVRREVLRMLRTKIVILDMELRQHGVDPGHAPLLPDAG